MSFRFQYTNHKGETEVRTVNPLKIEFMPQPGMANFHLTGYPPGWFLKAFDFSRNAERSFHIDPSRMKMVDPGEMPTTDFNYIPIADLLAVKDTVDNLSTASVDASAKMVREFAGFLMTSEKPIMAGAQYPMYDMQDRVDEFFTAKGMYGQVFKKPVPVQPSTVASRVGDQDNTVDH